MESCLYLVALVVGLLGYFFKMQSPILKSRDLTPLLVCGGVELFYLDETLADFRFKFLADLF
jgi:hypothetical protein